MIYEKGISPIKIRNISAKAYVYIKHEFTLTEFCIIFAYTALFRLDFFHISELTNYIL